MKDDREHALTQDHLNALGWWSSGTGSQAGAHSPRPATLGTPSMDTRGGGAWGPGGESRELAGPQNPLCWTWEGRWDNGDSGCGRETSHHP